MAKGSIKPFKLYVWWREGKVRSFETLTAAMAAFRALSNADKQAADVWKVNYLGRREHDYVVRGHVIDER